MTLRVEILGSADTLNLSLQGRFVGDDAEHARMLIARCASDVRLVVDLTEVVFVDAVGEEILLFFGHLGAEFIAPTSYALDVCERLRLTVTRTPTLAARNSGAWPK